ncbi:MAG: alanine--tRNA ligase [bacterium]|nr:alanine--tRNA ligase [bacterium]
MTSNELRQKFLDFFEEKGHKVIPSASLVPENDPSVLFTTAGMHPLVPYIMGEAHPKGKRLTDSQKCIRTDDIEEVGDKVHHTFFEMLGNWSFGDYFKEDAIKYSYEFLTDKKWLGIDKEKLAVTVFEGDKDAPFDEESYNIWVSLGISKGRIAKLGKKDNWWGPAGETGPCGSDTEMFYWSGKEKAPEKFDPEDERWVEIWNDVFMQYNKKADGTFEPLKQKNVDTGMGLERTLAVLNGVDDDYQTDLFLPITQKVEEISGKKYEENKKEFCIIADHLRAAVFAIDDGVVPSNKQAGYIIRRLIRRAIVKGHQLGINENFTVDFVDIVAKIYEGVYKLDTDTVKKELQSEEEKFRKTLKLGLRMFEKTIGDAVGFGVVGSAVVGEEPKITGKESFDLYQTYGFPLELTKEIATEKGLKIDEKGFEEEFKKHQELSRTASAGMFKGGLADNSEASTKYHTAAHLLLAGLQDVLGDHVHQRGSNITPERLRLDFSHPDKLTDEERKAVEDWVNDKIEKKLEVHLDECDPKTAKSKGAEGEFIEKYGDRVKVYSIGGDLDSKDAISKEICGGPHIKNTSELGHFRIKNETSSSKGVRRIKAVLE